MQFVLYALYFIHVLISIFLILVVLLQQGQGADLAVFGGGSTQAAFGARSATTLLHKLTVGGFVLFIATTTSIALFQASGSRPLSVVDGAAATTAPAVPGAADVAPPEAPVTETPESAGTETEPGDMEQIPDNAVVAPQAGEGPGEGNAEDDGGDGP